MLNNISNLWHKFWGTWLVNFHYYLFVVGERRASAAAMIIINLFTASYVHYIIQSYDTGSEGEFINKWWSSLELIFNVIQPLSYNLFCVVHFVR